MVSWTAGQEGCDCARQTGHLSQKRGARGAGGDRESAKTSDNVETINQLLNLYDKVLDNIVLMLETEDWTAVGERMDLIKSLQWLAGVIDQLMHRWYIVHRGYDANPHQACADVERKVSAANPAGEQPEESEYEIIPWESGEGDAGRKRLRGMRRRRKKGSRENSTGCGYDGIWNLSVLGSVSESSLFGNIGRV